jgi:hypothetical protein
MPATPSASVTTKTVLRDCANAAAAHARKQGKTRSDLSTEYSEKECILNYGLFPYFGACRLFGENT